MKNILVATDFSNDSYGALFYITQLMSSQPCLFIIINVFDDFTPLEGKGVKLLKNRKRSEALAIESREKLTQTYHRIVLDSGNPGHRFETLSKKGQFTEELEKAIGEFKIELLVMGSKGQTGAKEIFLGSNTIQAVNSIKACPVLAIPRQIDFRPPKEIAFVTDFKSGCTRATLAPLLFLASLSGAGIRVMHITEEDGGMLNTLQQSQKKLLQRCLGDIEHSFDGRSNYAYKAEVIARYLESFSIDLLAMVKHKRGFLERLVREPVIKDVNIYAKIPFLILPDRD